MKYQEKAPIPKTRFMTTLSAVRLERSGTVPDHEKCQVAIEDALSIDIRGVGTYTLMCTPTDVIPLAAGFALTEGIISSVDGIVSVKECMNTPGVVLMILADRSDLEVGGRNLIVNTSCGLCGSKDSVEKTLASISPVQSTTRVTPSAILDAVETMRSGQKIFKHTGGTHAAALFDRTGTMVTLAEDVGRHNALDKAIGKCLLAKIPTAGCLGTLSGRLSLEMVIKSARAGLEIVAAVSAASSVAISAAERLNITLCGFTRESRMTVFTHNERILSEDPSGTP